MTYMVLTHGNGHDIIAFKEFKPGSKAAVGIRCHRCKRVSFHPKDVEERYCGNCHAFHDEPTEATARPVDASGREARRR